VGEGEWRKALGCMDLTSFRGRFMAWGARCEAGHGLTSVLPFGTVLPGSDDTLHRTSRVPRAARLRRLGRLERRSRLHRPQRGTVNPGAGIGSTVS